MPPIALPPDASLPRPEHPIALPPGAVVPHPEHPIAYPPPPYATHQPYWAPGATFVAGAMLGSAFGYGFDWNNSEIDINVGADCCRGGNVDIGRGDRVDHRTGDRFNADKQWANGKDKLKWNPNKARQKQAAGVKKTGPQQGRHAAGEESGNAARRRSSRTRPCAIRRKLSGDTNLRGEKKSSLGNYNPAARPSRRATRAAGACRTAVRSATDRATIGRVATDRAMIGSRSNSGAFGGYNRGSTTRMQSSRGSRSMGGMRGGCRGGGRR